MAGLCFFVIDWCRDRLRIAKEAPEDDCPVHPSYPDFKVRRRLKRIYRHNRLSEVIDVIAIPSVVMAASTSIFEDNSPETLFSQAAKAVFAHPNILFKMEASAFSRIHDGLVLPAEVCDHLISTMASEGIDIDDRVAKAFGDPSSSRLRRLDLRNANISNEGLKMLVRHNLRELRLVNCPLLTYDAIEDISEHTDNLVELTLDPANVIMPTHLFYDEDEELDTDDEDDLFEEERLRARKFLERGFILRGPKLQRLTLRDHEVVDCARYFDFLFKPLPHLTHLDLSGLVHRDSLGDFHFLSHFTHSLVSLVLHNVEGILHGLPTISTLRSLVHLDISQVNRMHGHFMQPNVSLRALVSALPNLMSLDISGTNLAGTGSYECENAAVVKCDIPGLASRVDTPLRFLGLYKTENEASLRAHIPALEVSGEFVEVHLLTAAKRYLHRPDVLDSVLAALYHKVRTENCKDTKAALDIILISMEKYTETKKIQFSCTATLYYLVRSNIMLNLKVKRKILSTLLNVMYAHRNDTVVVRNGCLTLCQFELPHDVKFEYEKLVKILLFIVSAHTTEDGLFVQRAGICLLNSLACQVEGKQKLLVGNLGAMEKMLNVIRAKLEADTCDDVMETAWSTMWNVTDETPINCKRFLDGGGMELFIQCKERFSNSNDLLRNMMGLLGNVAEVGELRPQLMTPDFVGEFMLLLDSNSDGIETAYNAAGVLAHMASDGAEAWTIQDPAREDVLAKMVGALDRWDINTKRNINYRSFEPILRLIKIAHTPQCQHWAVWALANLTRTDSKYCKLIEEEGGLVLLEELINSNTSPAPYERILELALIVRENVSAWKQKMAASGHDGVEALDLDG